MRKLAHHFDRIDARGHIVDRETPPPLRVNAGETHDEQKQERRQHEADPPVSGIRTLRTRHGGGDVAVGLELGPSGDLLLSRHELRISWRNQGRIDREGKAAGATRFAGHGSFGRDLGDGHFDFRTGRGGRRGGTRQRRYRTR